MSQAAVPFQHPVQRCVADVLAALESVTESDPIYLPASAKAEVLEQTSRAVARLEGLRAAVLAAAGDVAEETGARSAGLWLAPRVGLDHTEGRRLQRLADAVADRYPRVLAGLREGRVSRPQADVIVRALDDLPSDLDPDLLSKAEAHLVAACGEFTPRELQLLGRRILDVIAPEVAEAHERRALDRDERRARAGMRLTTRTLGNGLTRITADLPTLHADLLLTQLHAHASPRRDHLEGELHPGVFERRDPDTGDRIAYPRLLAQGFCTLLERLPGTVSPAQGGDTATVLVTLGLNQLTQAVGVARLSTGHAITASEARRLACTAGIVPMVLNGASQPLDVGRKKRFHTPAMRKALAVRDRECRVVGCDIPAAWTEAHHLRPWAEGGSTNIDDAVLLCGFHHHRAHDAHYDMHHHPNGDIRFHRRS